MSDCYYHKCEMCAKLIPMHISFDRKRSDYTVYCKNHIKYAPDNAGVFTITKGSQIIEVKSLELTQGYIYPVTNFMPQTIKIVPGWSCAISGPDVGLRVAITSGLITVYSDTPEIAHPNVATYNVVCSKKEWMRKKKLYKVDSKQKRRS